MRTESLRPRAGLAALLSVVSLLPLFGCGGEEEFHPSAIEITLDGPASDTVSTFRRITVQGVGGSIGITDIRYTVTAGVGGATLACISTFEGCAVVDQHVTDDGADTTWVGFAQDAGTFSVQIQLLGHDIDTTITFTVLPGAAASARVTPGDTVLQVGATGTYAVHALDQWGNQRPTAGVVTPIDGGLPFVAGTQVATGATIGRYRLAGIAEGLSDTVEVSVVPVFSVVGIVVGGGAIVRQSLDRTGRALSVAASGLSNLAIGGSVANTIFYRRDNQARKVPLAGGSETTIDTWELIGIPSVMSVPHDSGWVFTNVSVGGYPYLGVGRFRPDGTGEQILGVPEYAAAPGNKLPSAQATPSANGKRIAYVRGDGAAFIRVFWIGDSASTWMVSGQAPRWSPVADQVAYVEEYGGNLRLLDPNTGSNSELTADSLPFSQVRASWSPDGAYLIALRPMGQWALVRVSDGLVLPLPTLHDLSEVEFVP